ncbi:MAG: 5-deoxy-glucuronate isomerase [Candidatus Firestonebacteria bacterium]|jgi:5-deoxy-glucuronate isomerase|nr:5-deoxy-glucuronate isomerase [Candidatus Firestonebacteria bacterium]
MSKSNLLYRKSIKNGFTSLVTAKKKNTKHIDFGILKLKKNKKYENRSATHERVVVILGGKCNITVDGTVYKNIGKRKNVFEGKPYSVYIPAGSGFVVQAVSADLEVAVCGVKSKAKGSSMLITPDMVRTRKVGKDNWQRDVYDIVYEATAGDKILVGETMTPSGNWSSVPPHRHEKEDKTTESKHEETYFFKINPEQGFGFQWVYTDNFSLNEIYVLKNDDLVVIPRGYHPVAAAPGYKVYYLWILAGSNRVLRPKDDPKHKWIKEA